MATRATNANKEAGTQAENYVARRIGGTRTPEAWYDVETSDGIHEVKSTEKMLDYSDRRGRFRLWKHQHENLRDHGGTYHFVVDGVGHVEVDPEVVDTIRQQEGLKWTGAGNTGESAQLKLTWTHVMTAEGEKADR
jgi:hypothetical protein